MTDSSELSESNPRCYCCSELLTLTKRLSPHPFAGRDAAEHVIIESWDCTNAKCYANPRLKVPTPPLSK